MSRFIIEETMPCWVTWRRIVEADTSLEALEKHSEGEGIEYRNPEIGDIVDGYDAELDAIEIEPIGAIMPDGTKLDQWDDRLRTAGGIPVYPDNTTEGEKKQ